MHFTPLSHHPRRSPSPQLGKFHAVQFDLDMSPQTGQQPLVQRSSEQLVKTPAESSQAKEAGRVTVAAAAADWTTCHAALTAPVSLTLAICLSRLLFLNIPTEQLMTAEE